MFELVTAVRFIKPMRAGRTKPVLIGCERASGDEVEVVAKFSAGGCNVEGIAREALMAMLAADLGLPVPEPFLVDIEAEFVDSLPVYQSSLAQVIRRSAVPTFGSALLPPGLSLWTVERRLSQDQIEPAAEIFAFDALSLNPDRRAVNPNCLSDGHRFAIFDHELGLMTETLGSFSQPYPWALNGLDSLVQGAGEHVLYRGLKGRGAQLQRLEGAWNGLSPQRISEYPGSLPPEWHDAVEAVKQAVEYLLHLQTRLVPAFEEIRRVLS